MNEKRLICALKTGDSVTLGKIIDRYSGYVSTVARNFSRGAFTEDDIDEICVDVFYNLWKNREKLDEDIELRAYLSAAARNGIKNRFKKQTAAFEDITELELPAAGSVEESAEMREIMNELKSALNELPSDEREIFFRFYFYGEGSSQIAEKTGIAEASVRTKLRRTRIKLKEFLIERGFENV